MKMSCVPRARAALTSWCTTSKSLLASAPATMTDGGHGECQRRQRRRPSLTASKLAGSWRGTPDRGKRWHGPRRQAAADVGENLRSRPRGHSPAVSPAGKNACTGYSTSAPRPPCTCCTAWVTRCPHCAAHHLVAATSALEATPDPAPTRRAGRPSAAPRCRCSQSARRCCTAWKVPSGRPNCCAR